MKKLLIATTALVGTASVAAADVTFNGYGRFGILYEEDRQATAGDGTVRDSEEVRLENRYRLNIDSSTETDAGIRFAARVRIQGDDRADNSTTVAGLNGARLQVNAGGLRVRVGNVSGVHDAAETVNFFGFEPGLIGQIGHYSTFDGGPIDAYAVRDEGVAGFNVKYEIDAFTVMASYSDNHDANLPNKNDTAYNTTGDYEAFEIGASYEFSGWTLAAGYGMADNTDSLDNANPINFSDAFDREFWTLTATGAIAGADVAFFVGDSNKQGADVSYGISGAYPVGAATSIVASYAGGGGDTQNDAYGIGVDHSLGGGVSLKGMVGRQTNENTIADFGVVFNF